MRTDLRDLDELAESIEESGIVEPLLVVPLDDGHRIVAGHRRAAAAVIAELDVVPCWIRADLANMELDQLAAALIENVQRDALKPVEEAHAYAQLSAFPTWSVERIAKAAGRDIARVRRSIDATKLPVTVQEPVISGDMTLAEAAEIEAFADDPTTYKWLVQAAERPGFRHVLARAQRDREMNERVAAATAELEQLGVTIVKKPNGFSGPECDLDDLTNDDDEEITPEQHADCPGHAAYINTWNAEPVYLCRDPRAYGHGLPKWYSHLTDEEAAARAAEKEAAQAREAALDAAAVARRNFVRERIATKGKPPTCITRLALELLLSPTVDLPPTSAIAWYLGHDDPDDIDVDQALSTALRKSSESRLPMLLLAVAAAASEENAVAQPSHSWRYSPEVTHRWLSFLEGIGYELSDAETGLLESTRSGDDSDSEAA
jgi:ParB family chromosome partitioning protein